MNIDRKALEAPVDLGCNGRMPLFFIKDSDTIAPADKRWTLIRANDAEEAADEARHLFWPELCSVRLRDDVPDDVSLMPQTAKPSAVRSQRLCLRPPYAPFSWTAILGLSNGQ